MPTARLLAVVAAAITVLAPGRARADDATWIIEATPEASTAATDGATDLARARSLAI